METLNYVLLGLHILSGYLALGSGALVMAAKKGNGFHSMVGKWYFFSMLVVCATSLALALIKDIVFLLHIGVFVFYQVFAGFRSARRRSIKPRFADRLVLLIAFVNGLAMIISQNLVLLIFGGIGLLLSAGDLRSYFLLRKDKPLFKFAWLARHIGMMMGAYIGTLTAFIVVNVDAGSSYGIWYWLAPTIILVPLMQYWIWKYTRGSSAGHFEHTLQMKANGENCSTSYRVPKTMR